MFKSRCFYIFSYLNLFVPTKSYMRNSKMLERWLSVSEIAVHLGVSKDMIYNWINEKKIPAHRIVRFWKFKVSEVDE